MNPTTRNGTLASNYFAAILGTSFTRFCQALACPGRILRSGIDGAVNTSTMWHGHERSAKGNDTIRYGA